MDINSNIRRNAYDAVDKVAKLSASDGTYSSSLKGPAWFLDTYFLRILSCIDYVNGERGNDDLNPFYWMIDTRNGINGLVSQIPDELPAIESFIGIETPVYERARWAFYDNGVIDSIEGATNLELELATFWGDKDRIRDLHLRLCDSYNLHQLG